VHHTTRSYLLPITAGTMLCLAAFASIVWSVDPYTSGLIPHIFFYITLFLTLAGLFTLLGISLRKKLAPGMFTEQLRISFRQAFLLSLLILGLIILQVFNLLFWWVGLTLVLFIIAVEIFLNA
jgi:hypothetical protein